MKVLLDKHNVEAMRTKATEPEVYEFFTALKHQLTIDFNYINMSNLRVDEKLIFNLFHPVHRHVPLGVPSIALPLLPVKTEALIEQEILQEGKSAFVGTTNEVEFEFKYLSKYYPQLKSKLQVGEGRLLYRAFGWIFSNTGKTCLGQYLKFLVESGIHLKLEEYLSISETRERVIRTRMNIAKLPQQSSQNAMSIRGRISTVFVLLSFLLVLSSTIFCLEKLSLKIVDNCLAF
jgi:hypothetical protein